MVAVTIFKEEGGIGRIENLGNNTLIKLFKLPILPLPPKKSA